ncbi:MAG: hypothetical protein LKJ25_04110 [Clostridia bacterium]|jgi:hypothetical protein|nr:hypothetical protein [Clostridia bacterium]
MKLQQALSYINDIYHNVYDDDYKIKWISELDGHIFNEIISQTNTSETFSGYKKGADEETELFAPFPYDNIYAAYIISKIDYLNGETTKYNNDLITFNQIWEDFAAWYKRKHISKSICFKNLL